MAGIFSRTPMRVIKSGRGELIGINRSGAIFFKCPSDCPTILEGDAKAGMINTTNDNKGVPRLTIHKEANRMGFESQGPCTQPDFKPRTVDGECFLREGGKYTLGSLLQGGGNKEQEP